MRTKKVFPTDELCHIWANQRQEEGRNSAGNVSFEGRTIWSYSTVQAQIAKHDSSLVFIVDYNYSNTTAKHVRCIYNAISHKTVMAVRYPKNVELYSENFWNNIVDMRNGAITNLQSAEAPRIRANTRIGLRQGAVDELNRIVKLLELFGLTIDDLKNKNSYGQRQFEKATFDYTVKMVKERGTILDGDKHLLEEFAAQKAKAEKAKIKADKKRQDELRKKAQEDLAAWLKGKDVDRYLLSQLPEIYLRAIPKNDATQVQTSYGAVVSLKKAKVLYMAIKAGKNVLGFDIDGYTVVENTVDHLKIGCHILLKKEIDRFAKLQKW